MAPVRLPGTSPRELETVAVTGGSPTASSTGKVTRVPEPTTALMEPAARPARATATISHPVMPASPRGCHSGLCEPAHRRAGGAGRLVRLGLVRGPGLAPVDREAHDQHDRRADDEPEERAGRRVDE